MTKKKHNVKGRKRPTKLKRTNDESKGFNFIPYLTESKRKDKNYKQPTKPKKVDDVLTNPIVSVFRGTKITITTWAQLSKLMSDTMPEEEFNGLKNKEEDDCEEV